ncbi:MAG: TIM44-like domain-containing protein [Desulfobacteraceae bacterium]|nr:TIM44-like domain-containing protein [Desulfobacteraceae bacterium]
MKKQIVNICAVLAAVMFLSITVLELNAHARAGGSRSFGSRGTRSYSAPATVSRPAPATAPSQQAAPAPGPFQQPQPAGGGFLRSMAGGMMGGLLGGMLFRSLGMAGGGMGGGGIGIFEIILLAGIAYLIYRFIRNRRTTDSSSTAYGQGGYQGGSVTPISNAYSANPPAGGDVETGLGHIRQMDASFDEQRFNDQVMDIFFKIQGSWMNRDLAPVSALLTEEMRRIMQEDLDRLLRDRQVNRLENIAVRNVEISEAWQESGQDYITALIYANLLDYTTDDTSGAVISGSKTDPVKFEEYWTFTRPVGNNPWRLSAINQK